MQFQDLPHEIIFRVFDCFSYSETDSIIHGIGRSTDPQALTVKKLLWVTRCFQKLVVSLPDSSYDTQGNHIMPKDVPMLCKELLNHNLIPCHLAFELSRNPRDYVKFQRSLTEIWEILDSPVICKQLHSIPRLDFTILGNTVTTESPTSLVSLILNTMVKMTNLKGASWDTINISLTDLGSYFPQKWGAIFEGFTRTKSLILQDNLIRLSFPYDALEDLFESYFRWPPHLIHLSLRNNLIKKFLDGALENLPESLETLDLSKNVLEQLGGPNKKPLQLHLPKLKLLDISENNNLCHLDETLFHNAHLLPQQLVIKLDNCNLYGPVLASLIACAETENIKIAL